MGRAVNNRFLMFQIALFRWDKKNGSSEKGERLFGAKEKDRKEADSRHLNRRFSACKIRLQPRVLPEKKWHFCKNLTKVSSV
jgi:hypothetical protein